MGYDMYLVKTTGDQERDYFRLNIWGMGRYADLMFQLGMGYDSRSSGWPKWDRYPDDEQRQSWFGNAHEHLAYDEPLDAAVPADVLEAAREYIAAADANRRLHPDGGDAIPLHKFSTNDGWIVTPAELNAALLAYAASEKREAALRAAFPDVSQRAYWDRWIEYLRLAVDHDGFKVW